MEGAILEPSSDVPVEGVSEDGAPAEVPSVFSVINHYLVGGASVDPPVEDGSRKLRLHSASGQAIIEASLSPQICQFLAGKLTEVEVIEEGDEDAGSVE